jgi:hypothetical protein
MKFITLLLILFISTSSVSQDSESYDEYRLIVEKNYYHNKLITSLKLGVLSHGFSLVSLSYYNPNNPTPVMGFVSLNVVGVVFDVHAVRNYIEYRKRKKLLKSLYGTY